MGLSFSAIRKGVTIFTPSHLLGGEGQTDFCPVVGGASGVSPSDPVAFPVAGRALGGQGHLSCPLSSSVSVSGHLPPRAPGL